MYKNPEFDVDKMAVAYIESLLFIEDLSQYDTTHGMDTDAIRDCEDFLEKITEHDLRHNLSEHQMGRSFAMVRQGTGCGFFDYSSSECYDQNELGEIAASYSPLTFCVATLG